MLNHTPEDVRDGLATRLSQHLSQRPDGTAVLHAGKHFRWCDWAEEVNQAAQALGPQNGIHALAGNSLVLAMNAYACSQTGRPFLPLGGNTVVPIGPPPGR